MSHADRMTVQLRRAYELEQRARFALADGAKDAYEALMRRARDYRAAAQRPTWHCR